jgi:hypothetical protein
MTKLIRAICIFGLFSTACSESGSDRYPTDAGGDAAGGISGSSGSGGAPIACIEPYPPAGSACASVGEVCVPTEGYDCCRCMVGHGCDAPLVWSCWSSYATCPASPPTAGQPCSLANYTSCVYCSMPALHFGCNDGTWSRVTDELYCQ